MSAVEDGSTSRYSNTTMSAVEDGSTSRYSNTTSAVEDGSTSRYSNTSVEGKKWVQKLSKYIRIIPGGGKQSM